MRFFLRIKGDGGKVGECEVADGAGEVWDGCISNEEADVTETKGRSCAAGTVFAGSEQKEKSQPGKIDGGVGAKGADHVGAVVGVM